MIFFRGKWGFEKFPSDAIQKFSKYCFGRLLRQKHQREKKKS
jgi:hypothetical protein